MEDDFLSQVIDSRAGGDVILDLLDTNASELISGVQTGGSLGFSDHTLVKFTVLRDTGHLKSNFRTLNFRREKLQLSRG